MSPNERITDLELVLKRIMGALVDVGGTVPGRYDDGPAMEATVRALHPPKG